MITTEQYKYTQYKEIQDHNIGNSRLDTRDKTRLRALAAQPAGQCLRSERCQPKRNKDGRGAKETHKVLGLDGDALGVDSREVRVLEERDEVRLGRLLERHHGGGLEAEVGLQKGWSVSCKDEGY